MLKKDFSKNDFLLINPIFVVSTFRVNSPKFKMEHELKKEGRYKYYEAGEGTPIIILHGLMGGLSNFEGVAKHFSQKGYKIVIPELPLYTQNILKTKIFIFF